MLKFGFGVLGKTERGREEGKGFWIETGFNVICLSYETDFADWTWEEFKRHRLGAAQNCSATLNGNHKLTDAVRPPTVRYHTPHHIFKTLL